MVIDPPSTVVAETLPTPDAGAAGQHGSSVRRDEGAVTVSTDVDECEWDAFLAQHPDATCEHLWGWREVLTRAFGHDCVYLAARRGGARGRGRPRGPDGAAVFR